MRAVSCFRTAAVIVLCSGTCLLTPNPVAAQQGGAYRTGIYRDLFVEGGHSGAEVHAKVDAAYRQLFSGQPASEKIYFAAGSNARGELAYILNPADNDVRTEGMSYAMMIAVQLDHRDVFDALWNWARTYMYIDDPANPAFGYYAWLCKPSGQRLSNTPAPDGEEYFAAALYFASARWGDRTGIYDYHARADELLRTLLHHKHTTGSTAFGPRDVEAEFSPEQHMVRFLPEPGGRDFSDPSYHLPGFYELWARWGPREDRAFWAEAARTSRLYFAKATDPVTGLNPSYADFDGTPHPTDFVESAVFGHDAWRTAANWSWDWSWFAADPQAPARSARLQAFFDAQLQPYGQLFTLTGKTLDTYPAAGLVAANAVASLAAPPDERSRRFVDALWNEPVPQGKWRYYDGLLYMLGLLHVSGEFRIFTPAWASKDGQRAAGLRKR